MRINLSTGSTTSVYRPVTGYNNDQYIGYIAYKDNGYLNVWDERNLEFFDYFDNPQQYGKTHLKVIGFMLSDK